MEPSNALNQTFFQLGATSVSVGAALVAAAAVMLLVIIIACIIVQRSAKARLIAEIQAEDRARDAEARMSEILKSQAEMQGRMQTMAELFGSRQSELNQSIRERLDGMTVRIGNTMTEQTKSTHENLARLQERLAVIDTAQNNIQSLAGQVVQLQAILANKQTRGAFGQARMEAIIADGLPQGAYEFQATLSNGSRPDCLVRMPNGAPSLVIDAKFPLEAWNAIRAAESAEEKRDAASRFKRDLEVHIRDVADKYLLNGETQDTAFLFVPSESIFGEIHENFEAIVQRAHRSRIVIVSPSLLMLSIQVIQAVLKDVRMREQAHLIQKEVVRLMEDVGRLDDRVRKLQGHFGQASKDIDDILVSSSKVTKRGQKIEALELAEAPADSAAVETSRSAASATGQLRLRVVEGDD
ncbi:DNA recombination protein RmuC [Phyllobacterium sp. 0TCS1.6C]|uniref:DNA recombination protein RmuC n=1 Tax=unclassified Phyllobacterium TaxID=2638441 RepID=UPI0022655BFD|nr:MULTISPECIES: DNA recombination protein RmuC [unclassified Phyllobacterium]MCX8281807.1 DNA recombination protein RmuC [Phyllobacterium sp. 0TCS1.6C]MCX8295342.1 DNA recombination protein RmuC [Phyllobacterium sp. 0TCS1.6A]